MHISLFESLMAYLFSDAMLTELMNGTEGSVGDLGPVGPKKNGQVRILKQVRSHMSKFLEN